MSTSRRTARTLSRLPILAFAALTAGACATQPRTPAPESVAGSIVAMLQASAQDWNRGDLDGFLRTYQDSSGTTFMTAPGVIHGLQTIRERYRKTYFTAGALPPQLLRFEQLAVRPLGPDYARATGRFILTDRATGAAAGSGNFSLVLRRTVAGWTIIHDHSSAG